jgi:hypothetical protein
VSRVFKALLEQLAREVKPVLLEQQVKSVFKVLQAYRELKEQLAFRAQPDPRVQQDP